MAKHYHELQGFPTSQNTWTPWLKGDDIARELYAMYLRVMLRLSPKPPCLRCGTELLFDEVTKTAACHACQRIWTKLEYVLEMAADKAERMRISIEEYMGRSDVRPLDGGNVTGGYPPAVEVCHDADDGRGERRADGSRGWDHATSDAIAAAFRRSDDAGNDDRAADDGPAADGPGCVPGHPVDARSADGHGPDDGRPDGSGRHSADAGPSGPGPGDDPLAASPDVG